MPRPAPLPEGLPDDVFTSRHARALGVSRGRLSRSDLARPFHGVRMRADTLIALVDQDLHEASDYWHTLELVADARLTAVGPLLRDGMALSHTTAARIHKMPLPASLQRDLRVHVSVARQEDRPQINGVRAHLAPRDVRSAIVHGRYLITDPVQTWCALAAGLTIAELVTVGDDLVRRIDPPATIEELRLAVHRSAGRHGSKRLRASLELVRPRTDSPKETELRLILLDAGLPEPTVNQPLFDVAGQFIRHGDLAYEEYQVLVEYNGEQHRTDAAQFQLDTEQHDRIAASGWLIVQVVKAHMRTPTVIAQRVRAALSARGWHP